MTYHHISIMIQGVCHLMNNPNPQNKSRIREYNNSILSKNWSNKSITIVTQNTCAHCKELIRHLENYKIPYDVIDINTEEGRKLAIESKSRTTPVVALRISDGVHKYLSLDNISLKCMITEIQNHIK